MPRLSGGLDPRGGLVEEEVHGPGPREERGERVDRWLPRNAFPVPDGVVTIARNLEQGITIFRMELNHYKKFTSVS